MALDSKVKSLYDTMKADGADVGTEQEFNDYFFKPGEEGYQNRHAVWKAFKDSGADIGENYEEFADWLGLQQKGPERSWLEEIKTARVGQINVPPDRGRFGEIATLAKEAQERRTQREAQQASQAAGKATAPVQKAQPQVRAQTRPTSQQPAGTVAAFKLRRGGHDFYVTQQEVNEAGGLGAWAAKHPGAPVRVYMHGDGFTGHVDLSEASKRRKEKGYKYTLEYRPGHKVKRNKSGWVDNLVEYGQEAKAIEEMTAPTKQVVEQLWSAAEKKQTTDARNNYDALNNKWSRTGDDMPFVDSSVRYLANETDRMKNFDLDKMSEEAWRRSGAALTQKVYQRLKLANPKTDDSKLIEQAEAEAWRLTNKAVYDYAVEKNMPKSVLEYFFKKVMDQNSVVSLLRGTARSMAGTTGDRGAYEAAQEEYGKKHKVASVAGTVVGMGADPMMTLTGGAGGAAGKAVLNVGGRLIAKKAAGTAVETGTRLFANKLGAKVAAGVASGSVNLGMYEGLKEGERQFLHGGYINPETGQNEGYSLQAMFESAGKGAILGAATGVISPIFGNVGNKLVGKADRISSTGGSMAAKAGIRATQHLVATGLEGTIFATEGWLTTDEDKVDVWLDSMATMIGFKGHHIIKSAPRVIAGMRPVKPTADRPLTIDERNFNRKSFVERVSAMLDGPKFADERRNGSGMPLSFTKDDISTLKEAGYGSLADIFRSDRAKEADKPFEERVLDALGEDESTAEMSNGSGGLLDGYSEMEKLVKDASVPQEIRAKAYYALTGHCLGAGTITGHATRETDDGRIAVDALTNNGEIVYRRYYKSKDAANAATEKLDRQIELNKIDVGEQYADAVADETILDDVIKAQYPDNNPENIKKIYYGVKYGKARADEHLRKGIDAIDKEIEARKDEAADMRPDAIRKAYGEEYGVDIDDAIRKPSGDRSEAEKRAVESYIARLFASGETRVDRYDSKSDSYVSDVSDVADAADVAETQPETQPIGLATMKFRDGPVEVLSGRVVMTENGKMVDVERSDKTIVVRDPATGKTEMVSPEAMLSYEDVAPEVAADERSMPKYSSGRIVIRDADGKERRGFLTGDVDDQGRYEYYLAGDLNHLFYATEEELDNRVTKFVPDRRNDVADVSDVADLLPTQGKSDANVETADITIPERKGSDSVSDKQVSEAESSESALERLPRDEKGQPVFERAETPEIAWDALVEFSDGDVADAKEMADIVTEQKRKALEKLQKQKPKGASLAELRESQKVIKAAREQAEQEYNFWQQMAGVEQLRQEADGVQGDGPASAVAQGAQRGDSTVRSQTGGIGLAEARRGVKMVQAGLRTERPERGANYYRLKSDLVGFAKKFKDAGTANITAIEREMSEWMSKQTADDIVDLDARMLSDVCNEAGLDKGKAWAFRMSVDHATPKGLIEEVFKIRNDRRAQIAPRGIADVDGFDMLSPESQAVVEHYLSEHGSKAIRVITGMDDIRALGFPKEVSEAFEEVVAEGGIPALYNSFDKKIYIFADVFNSARRDDGHLFHENVHGAIDECGSYPGEFLSSFRRKVVSSGYKPELFRSLESMLKDEYDKDSVDEEFLAYTLQWMLNNKEREPRIMELLGDEEKEFIYNNILNKIRYAQRRRKTESASEEVEGHETLHAARQRADGGDGVWFSRKAAVGDERRGNQGMAGESADGERSEGHGSLGAEVYEAAKGLLESAGVDVVEVSDTEAAEMLNRRGSDVSLMGSRTNRKMAKIAEYFEGRELDENQQAVVDVFSGKRDNIAIEVERPDGKRRVVMRQGNELKAGAKHSLFRHYESEKNNVIADDIALISEVIANGERSVSGNRVTYDIVAEDGTRLRVTTEITKKAEVFTNFYTNRKTSAVKSSSVANNAVVTRHHSGAQSLDPKVSDAKIGENSETGKPQLLKTSEGVVYGWTVGGKVYLNRDAMNPETPLHEYTHLWDEMVRRENPELWARGKELMKQTPMWQEVIEDPNYGDIRDDEDAVASEVHSRLTGKDGARILSDMIEDAKKDGPLAVAERVTLVERLKRWLGEMFSSLKKTLSQWSKRDLAELTVEDFVRMTLRDLAEGINPKREMQRGDQMRMVTKENPMLDDYHTGIRTREDVKTFDEMLSDAEANFREYGSLLYPDMDIEMLREAKRTGEITVYSSKPIRAGHFVTPSRMNAEDYAGGEKVYSKKVSIEDIAWISEDEGQFAPVHEVANDEGSRFHAAMSRGREEFDALRERAARETSPQNIGKNVTENERLSAIRALKPIKIERNSMSREELFAKYKSLPTVNKNGNKIRFLRTAFGKNYKEGGLFAQISPRLNDVLSSAVLAYSEKDSLGGTTRPDGTKHKAHPNVLSFDNYVNKVSIENCEYYVRMTVQNTVDNTTGLQSCFVSDIDLYENTAIGRTDSAISRRPNDSFSGIVDAKLQQFFERASSVESKNFHGASEGENGASDEADSQDYALGNEGVIHYRKSADIDAEYPNWLDGTTTESGKHSTQVEGTRKTYGKLGSWIEASLGKDVSILDASSGMGYGTKVLRERGFNIEDVEPYQSEQRKAENPATYDSYSKIEKQYDYIISNAVLNVVPDDWRTDVLHDMAGRLKVGGRLFINTRKAGEEKSIKDKIELDSPREILVRRNGKISSYQRFFTPKELKEWVEKELGDGYEVEVANERNSGTNGLAAVVVTKTIATRPDLEMSEAKRSHAEKLAKKFNTPITIVDDVENLPAAMRNKKGGYDVRSGNVIVVIPNHADVEDVAETVFHEVVAHKGLREMLGEENYDAFCDEIYGHLKDDLKRQVDTEAGRRFMREPEKGYEHHRRVAVDELFGRMAEKGFEDFTKAERGIWAKLKAKVLEAINKFLGSLKLPKWVRLGDNELRYILWRSHERLGARAKAQEQVQNEALDFVDMARDVAKRAELGLNKSDVIVTRSRKTTADRIEESFDAAVAGELTGKPVEIGRLTKEGREYLEKLSGLKLKDVVSLVLNPSDLAHIYRRHFGKNETDARNIPLTKDDIRQMAYVVSSPDKVIFGKEKSGNQRNMFFFLKETDNGSYNLMEVYSDRKGNLTAKSYFKSKEGVSQRAMLLNESSTLTSVTDGATLSDSAKLPKFFESATISEEESFDFRYRDGETGDIWKDQSIGLKEKITYAALRLSKAQADDLTLRNDAMAAIGDNLKNLLHDMRNRRGTTQRFAGADHKVEADIAKAKAAQLRYDRSTVKRVGDLARILMQTGYLSDMTSGEILRLMSAVKNSVGGNDIESSVDKIMDIMIGNQLRNAEDALHSLLSIRGSKVDSRGVEVQGELDVEGQRTIEVVKRTINLNEDDITSLMDDARDRMGDSDKIIADNAAIEYAGLNMALDYAQNIANSKAEETALRYDLKTANEDMKVGRLTENAYKQLVDSIDEAIRKNKIERAEAYVNLVGRLSGSLRESIENAKAFRNAEKARVREIQHNANSDMEGRPSNEHHKDDWKDRLANGFSSTVLAPLGTFDQILRTFGNKSVDGEGYLWNRFMRGWVDCRNKELLGVKNKFARLDEKVAEICDRYNTLAKARGDSKNIRKVKNMAGMIKLDGKLPTATVKFWDGGEMREHELRQGNLLYIYMVDKMTDGRMKLRRMGITEEDIASVEKALDPRFKEFGDWLQEEFLVDTRNEYNETHKRIFGASMAAIENYFPLKILSNARADKEEDLDQQWQSDGITTKTGSIIKRRTNSLALDIMGSNALSVVLDHITEMEHWNAYVEWNRDLNTLRTYKRFRNQVINMATAYGGGEKLWKSFNNLCRMAAGRYRPPISELDKGVVNLAKGVTAAKVSLRIFTALKQFLSAPAYIPEVSVASISKSLLNPYGDFKWCMENLPIFYERWHSRISGDPRLLKGDGDWKMWRQSIVYNAARLGMTPNAFVDALTVSIGARAIYQTRLKRYLKEGYTDEEAEKRAKQDATILFNQTQQSSEAPFMSTMQADRTWINVLFTVFRNSSMSYTRQEYDALRNLKRNLTPGQRAKSIEFMTKQILRDWDIDPDTATDAERNLAQSAAKKRFRRQLKKDVVRLATFGFILQLAWLLGAYLPYIIFGDDEDEKDKMWDDALTHAYFGSLEGLTGGDVMSSFGNMWASGEWNERQLTKDMPLASDISSIIRKFGGGKNIEAINDIVNLAVQSGIGVNPQSITDVVVAITDACGDDPQLSHEAAICIMRILQVPQSQIDKMYFDEVGLSGREISQYTPGQLAQRYAEYRIMRGTPFVPWTWGDEEEQSKYEKSAQKEIKDRLAGREDDEVVAAYEDLDDRYKSFTKKIGSVKEMMGTDYIAAAQKAAELQNDPDFKIYQKRNALDAALDKAMRKWPPQRRERVKDLRLESTVAGVPQSKLAIKTSEQKKVSLTGELNRIANKYFTAETPEEARLIADTMAKYRALIVDAMQTDSEAEQEAAISELSTLIHDFRTKEEEMRSTKR